jgi:threonine/homoserine/homoserine lactone efflux protein
VPPHLLAFAGLSAVLVAIPGPAVVLVMKSAIARGRRTAVITACGVLVADLVWALASVAGLTALLVSSRTAFEVLRYAGAAYLLYLGVRLLLTRDVDALRGSVAMPRVGVRRAFVEGLLCDLSNPKTLIVFASVIPQFLAVGSSGPLDALVLGVVFAVLGFGSLLVYAAVFGAARGLVRHARAFRVVIRGGGALLAAFGVGLVVEQPST